MILELLAGALLSAAHSPPDDAYNRCLNSTSSNVEWARCGDVYLKQLEDALNVAWRKAYASLDDRQSRRQLVQEQRAWIKFKDQSCRYWTNSESGREGQVLHSYGCRGAITDARISDLKGIYELTHQDERPSD
jgi:uncharacterized protein YecT (DUF1311 family)